MQISNGLRIVRERPPSVNSGLAAGLMLLLPAAALAILIHQINGAIPDQPERAVLVVGAVFALVLSLPPAVYLFSQRRLAEPAKVGLIVLATVGLLLVAVYLYWVSFHVRFPADILIWSESDFVNDILKFRVGYPLYTAQQNNESFTYPPGTQVLTYLLAWLSGNATSIPVYRMIQVGYTLLAAVVATISCRKLVAIRLPANQFRNGILWGAVWFPIFFLIASNSVTNPFVHNLHNDALAQLLSVVAYGMLLQYVVTRDKRTLAGMAVFPALGFLVKQNLVIWVVLYGIQLAIFDQPRSVRRLIAFTLVALAGVATVVGAGYLLWGSSFSYWLIEVLGSHTVSPLRGFQHLLDVWPFYFIGLLGGYVLVRGKAFQRLLGPWLIWLVLILLETYTSGIAWMLNHIGPGSLIAAIWFLAALVELWPLRLQVATRESWQQPWLRVGITMGMVGLLFSGLGIVRIPLKPLSDDAYRYVEEIETEFKGQPTEEILLDMGTWVYVTDGVIMKDRVPSIGERGYSGTGDFSGILNRLEQKHYSKILVRNLHSPDFHYDLWMWHQSSGIRSALLDNYEEIRQIEGVSGESYQYESYFFFPISVLVPKAD